MNCLRTGETPLHSHEIRSRQKGFLWLRDDGGVTAQFLNELTDLMLSLPVTGFACVIDRTGYNALKAKGPWFDGERSSSYAPLGPDAYAHCLYEFRVKQKKSLLMTIADLYLWPMCMGGYDGTNRAYVALKAAGKLIDCHLTADEVMQRGIKYSCFEAINIERPTNTKTEKLAQLGLWRPQSGDPLG